jgi:glycosyltransferase involved in cell wall biosynthesis
LERHVDAYALGESVTLLGRVSDEDLLALYRAADVNVVPSISFEGFGLVVLEAAACGTPSIVTRAGGLPEAIAGLGRDLSVPTEDVQALADRLARATDGQLPSREGTRAWAEGHGWKQVAVAHERLFERVSSAQMEPRRLRVVYVDHVAQPSGAELALVRLCQALTEVDAHVILAEDGPLVDLLLRAGIAVEVLQMRHRTQQLRKDRVTAGDLPARAVFDTLSYSLRLAWRLRRLRPDIVHTNTLKSAVYGSIAARLARRPLVLHLRDRIETDYLPPLAVRLMRLLTRQLPDVVIGNSEATLRTVQPKGPSVVIWSVVSDMAHHDGGRDRPRQDLQGPLVVGIVGRLAPWKGQDVFLRAFASAFPEGDQRAVIIGAPLFGDAEVIYGEGLRNLAAELGVGSRVEFRGHRDDISAELRAMDVLVHASTVPEPFGQAVIEGMSAALPVVASRGGGPEEIITDGVDGLLYPRGDVEALREILTRLDMGPQLRAELGRAAVQRASDFSPTAVADRVMDAYTLADRRPVRTDDARLRP